MGSQTVIMWEFDHMAEYKLIKYRSLIRMLYIIDTLTTVEPKLRKTWRVIKREVFNRGFQVTNQSKISSFVSLHL